MYPQFTMANIQLYNLQVTIILCVAIQTGSSNLPEPPCANGPQGEPSCAPLSWGHVGNQSPWEVKEVMSGKRESGRACEEQWVPTAELSLLHQTLVLPKGTLSALQMPPTHVLGHCPTSEK